MRHAQKWAPVLLWLLIAAPAAVAPAAGGPIAIVARTVLASNEGAYMDPGLGHLSAELRSVFRYSSYRLLSQDSMSLALMQSGAVALPGGHTLQILPSGISGRRAELKLSILQDGRLIFNTVVQLRNRSSVTVGGPKHQGGYLLFNISASF